MIWVMVDGKRRLRAVVAGRAGGAGTRTSQRAGRPRWNSPAAGWRCERYPASDDASVERASREILQKYRQSSHAQEMVRSEILPTTLRLEPL